MNEPLDLYPDTEDNKSVDQEREDAKELANQATIKAWINRVNRLKSEKKEV